MQVRGSRPPTPIPPDSERPSTPSSRHEHIVQLLTGCISAEFGFTHSPLPSLSTQDTHSLISIAEEHGLIPCLFSLATTSAPAAPPPLLDAIDHSYRRFAAGALWYSLELKRVLRALADRDIPCLALKGPALSKLAYRDSLSRQFTDLDVAIPRNAIDQARSALLDLGYSRKTHSLRNTKVYFRCGYEEVFHHPQAANLVELHWKLVPDRYAINLSLEECLPRAVSVDLGELTAKTLSPEDSFLFACVHAAKHNWDRLSFLRDIVALSRNTGLDWSVIQRRAQRSGIARQVGITLLLASDLLRMPVPAQIGTDAAAQAICRREIPRLRMGRSRPPSSASYFFFAMRCRERWRDRLRMLLRFIFMPGEGDLKRFDLTGGWRALYPFLRAMRAMTQAARSLAGALHAR